MTVTSNRRTALALMVAAASGGAKAAVPGYPSKPIRMYVPAAPGGAADFFARIVGPRLGTALGQSIIIENQGGASGTIAASMVARSAPDGYNFFMAQNTSVVIAPHVLAKLPYDTLEDLAPVTMVSSVPHLLVVNPAVSVSTVRELIQLAKDKPGTLNFGSSGNGSASHLAGEMFNTAAGIKLVHVPYKGAGAAVNALLANEIQMMFAPIVAVMPHVKASKLRAIALTPAQRSPNAPGIPTIAESGLPGYDIMSWYGVFVAAKTPGPIIDVLQTEIAKVLALPEVKEQLEKNGSDGVGNSPQAFGAFVRAEYAKYAEVVKQVGAKLD